VNRRSPQADLNPAALLAQATLRLRSELQCERVIQPAHGRGVSSATAYRGPEDGGSPVSVIRESVEHVSPADFLGGGVLRPRPFRAEVGHLGWVFAGGTLGAGARLLIESAAASVSPFHDAFPWGLC
jgi:fluoride exporter